MSKIWSMPLVGQVCIFFFIQQIFSSPFYIPMIQVRNEVRKKSSKDTEKGQMLSVKESESFQPEGRI